MSKPEFDQYSASYDEMVDTPLRSKFAGADTQFFHKRKRDLIIGWFHGRNIDVSNFNYLDVGCGRGELLVLLEDHFARVAGCDLSSGMLSEITNLEVRKQASETSIPYGSASLDFVTAVCVYHHVAGSDRLALTSEITRVLKPGGIFAMFEHNPYNPLTRFIVNRTPVDKGAVLLNPSQATHLMRSSGLIPQSPLYFLYFPELAYRNGGKFLEPWLSRLPMGGQYAVFGKKCAAPEQPE